MYLAAVNILAFICFGVDKYKAKTNQWRISEKTLLGIAVCGGSLGAILGMRFPAQNPASEIRPGAPGYSHSPGLRGSHSIQHAFLMKAIIHYVN